MGNNKDKKEEEEDDYIKYHPFAVGTAIRIKQDAEKKRKAAIDRAMGRK